MPLKTASATLSSSNNANIAETLEQDLQIVTIGQLREVVDQIN